MGSLITHYTFRLWQQVTETFGLIDSIIKCLLSVSYGVVGEEASGGTHELQSFKTRFKQKFRPKYALKCLFLEENHKNYRSVDPGLLPAAEGPVPRAPALLLLPAITTCRVRF